MASPTRLRDGTWGARVKGRASKGDRITITTRDGDSWEAVVTRVVWTGKNNYGPGTISLCETSSGSSGGSKKSSEPCAECGEGVGAHEAADSSGVVAKICSRCYNNTYEHERSYA